MNVTKSFLFFVFFTGRNEVVVKVMFLLVSVILSTGEGVSASVHAGIPPPWEQTSPPEQTPPREQTPQEQTHTLPPPEQTSPWGADTPPEADPPVADTPLPGADTPLPPEQTPPQRSRHPPSQKADSSIRSMSGRYASYWNAFLCFYFVSNCPA